MDIFSTPFHIFNMGNQAKEFNDALVRDIEIERADNDGDQRSNVGCWMSFLGLEKKHESFAQMQSVAQVHVFQAMQEAKFTNIQEEFVVKDLWAIAMDKPGDYISPHIHGSGNMVYTGVYYPSTGHANGKRIKEDEDLDKDHHFQASTTPASGGNLVLVDPARSIKSQVINDCSIEKYPYYGIPYVIAPRESILCTFPNWVEHYVTPLTNDEVVRYSISFCVYKRKKM